VSGALGTSLSGRAAITGIGATEFSKDSGRSELRLAAEAVKAAIADAGLTPHDVDGLVTFTQDNNHEAAVAREVGIPSLSFFSRVNYGGGAACGTVLHAAMAVVTGVAKHVVCYRAFNERSGQRYGQVQTGLGAVPTSGGVDYGWSYPFGLSTPAGWVAMIAQRYLHAYGATSEDFGRISVIDRKHAATNPKAFFHGKPISLADHQSSRWIVEPLHLLDCCQESDGGVAFVVSAAERAADLAQPPVIVRAAARHGPRPVHDDLLLPRRTDRPARDGTGRRPAVAAVPARARGHGRGRPLRPLHPVRAHPARGARVLPAWRGPQLHRRRRP
jgi:acetyl-CoA acetyltransferase